MSTIPKAELKMAAPEPLPHDAIFDTVIGYWKSRCVAIAAELELADFLHEGAKSVDVLAGQTNTHAPTLYRLMRALESYGTFKQVAPRVFANTPASACLRKSDPDSKWAFVRLSLSLGMGQFEAWTRLLSSIQTGKIAFNPIFGQDYWEYVRQKPERTAIFDAAMRSGSAPFTPAVTAAFDWKRFPLIADIGGGIGTQLVDILDANPSCHGILFDHPDAVASAIPHTRVKRVGGDFLKAVPGGADLYLLRFVIHDWEDKDALRILRSVRNGMHRDSRIVLAELVIPQTPEPSIGKWTDLAMLILVGGRERTAAEFSGLLDEAGFRLEKIIPTASPLSLIVGRLS